MGQFTRKRQGQIVRRVFEMLEDRPEGMPANEVLAGLARQFDLTPYEAEDYPGRPGVRRFEKLVRFSTIAPVKAGWLVKSNGRWILTEAGSEALERYPDPEQFVLEASSLYRQWERSQPGAVDVEDADDAQAADSPATSLEEAEDKAREGILAYLGEMRPYDVQELVAALLRAMGYHVSWVSPPGPDGGIDIVAHTDPLGAREPRIKVQVKRREAATAVDGLRAFMALLGGNDLGIFVSTGGFTSAAQQEARQQESRKITLLDAGALIALWIENYAKLDESAKRLLPLRPVYYLAGD